MIARAKLVSRLYVIVEQSAVIHDPRDDLHIMFNAYWEALEFEVPRLDDTQGSWRRCVDTFLDSPDDICDWADARTVQGATCRAEPRSVILLFAGPASP